MKQAKGSDYGKPLIKRKQVFRLSYPPSANRYWRVANNRLYKSEEAKSFIQDVCFLASQQKVCVFTGNLDVTLRLFRPLKKGDIDNRIKVLLDSLNNVAFEDDSQIVNLHVYRLDDKNDPRVEVEILELNV